MSLDKDRVGNYQPEAWLWCLLSKFKPWKQWNPAGSLGCVGAALLVGALFSENVWVMGFAICIFGIALATLDYSPLPTERAAMALIYEKPVWTVQERDSLHKYIAVLFYLWRQEAKPVLLGLPDPEIMEQDYEYPDSLNFAIAVRDKERRFRLLFGTFEPHGNANNYAKPPAWEQQDSDD